MIKIVVGSNTTRNDIMVDEMTATPKSVFKDQGVAYTSAGALNYLDGVPLTIEDMNSTFEELGVREECALMSIMKLNNN